MTKSNGTIQKLFENNRAWAEQSLRQDPAYFSKLAGIQNPEYLWIGCSDSRVPANQITGLAPGEVFVHRNVANVVVHSDLNCLSVMQYAVEVLKVKHIIVCGHYGCGGVQAALQNRKFGLIDNWLRHVQDVMYKHAPELKDVDEQAQWEALCELNVVEQVLNVCQTTILEQAWERGQEIAVHGWVYDLRDGLMRDLAMNVAATADIPASHAEAIEAFRARRVQERR